MASHTTDQCLRLASLPGRSICTIHPFRGMKPWTVLARGHPIMGFTPSTAGGHTGDSRHRANPHELSAVHAFAQSSVQGLGHMGRAIVTSPAECGEREEPAGLALGPGA